MSYLEYIEGGTTKALYLVGSGLLAMAPFALFAQAPTYAGSTPAARIVAKSSLPCDDRLKDAFHSDALTKVLSVKYFKKGEVLPNPTLRVVLDATPETAEADLCLVKLLVGPGNPGPSDAPSTSDGIGIEVWLPDKAHWNGRLHAIGGGGWAGSAEKDPTKISGFTSASDGRSAPMVAAQEGAVTATTDTGHVEGATGGAGGSFGMNPDGTINTVLWNDFAHRAIHEQVINAKALAKVYFGTAIKYTYWDGVSTGGRQALKQAQKYPQDFNGIISAVPAINWTKFILSSLYSNLVIQRDLGGKPLTAGQLSIVSNAAISACDIVDGKHLGFILRQENCRYDPTKDVEVLCIANGGNNNTPSCVSRAQALAMNKMWYGPTADGSVPDPAIDNGYGQINKIHKWYGWPRGTFLLNIANTPPITTDMIAIVLQNPALASPTFKNTKSNGDDQWKQLSYDQFDKAFERALEDQPKLGFINTDNPDLTAFKAHGGKLIHIMNANDNAIMPQGSINYYEKVLARMGGLAKVQKFYRLYTIPGAGHGLWNGTANPHANPPVLQSFKGEAYKLITDWVEKGISPGTIVIRSAKLLPLPPIFADGVRPADGQLIEKSLPMCIYPAAPTYVSGNIYSADSYFCRADAAHNR